MDKDIFNETHKMNNTTTVHHPVFLDCKHSNSVHVEPPLDPENFDLCYYTNQDLNSFNAFQDDVAFWPTVVIYSFTFFVGITGNILVIFALLADRKSRNVTSSFLVSLAVADMLFLLICVPYETLAKFSIYWVGGRILCKIAGFVEILSASASVLNLTAVSVERYAVIVHPMKSRSWCTMGNTKKIILIVWVVAILFSSPLLHIKDTEVVLYYNESAYVTTYSCSDAMLVHREEQIGFAWYMMIIMFILPVIIMLFAYVVVIHVLWISTKQLARMTNTDGGDDESKQRLTASTSPRHHVRSTIKDHSAEMREARKQVIRMLLAIIAVFFLCWGPKLIYNVLKRHELKSMHTDAAFIGALVINLLPYIQSCSNPIIYSFMSKNFRRSMRMAFRHVCHCDPCQKFSHSHRRLEFDMETKNANGMYSQSVSMTSRSMGRSYVTVMSEA